MARDHNPTVAALGYRRWLRELLDRRGWRDVRPDFDQPAGEVAARVIEAQWVVYCPHCPGVIIVDDSDPVHFCPDCLNAGAGGVPQRVVFQHQAAVERLFARRADPRHRNWLPGESLKDLVREQRAHGEL